MRDQALGWALTALLGVAVCAGALVVGGSLMLLVVAMPLTTIAVALVVIWALWRRVRVARR